MKFVFAVVGDEVKAVARLPIDTVDDVKIVAQDQFPRIENKGRCIPVLKYSKEKGIYWDYIPTPHVY